MEVFSFSSQSVSDSHSVKNIFYNSSSFMSAHNNEHIFQFVRYMHISWNVFTILDARLALKSLQTPSVSGGIFARFRGHYADGDRC